MREMSHWDVKDSLSEKLKLSVLTSIVTNHSLKINVRRFIMIIITMGHDVDALPLQESYLRVSFTFYLYLHVPFYN